MTPSEAGCMGQEFLLSTPYFLTCSLFPIRNILLNLLISCGFPPSPGILTDLYGIREQQPCYPASAWRERVYPAGKEVSVKVITCKYVPWWCRKLLRKALFTVISPPQQHLQQMLALFPWGSALKKTLQQGCCSLHFQEHDVHKAWTTAVPSTSRTIRYVHRCLTVIRII